MCDYVIGYNMKWWHFFIKPHVGLCYRKKEGFRFCDEEILHKNAESDFCVIAVGRYIHAVCQDISGDIIYYVYDGTVWQREVLLESKTAKPYEKHFKIAAINGYINLLYTIRYKDRLMLVHQLLGSNLAPAVIDYIAFAECPYCLSMSDGCDFSLFYENEDGICGERKYKWSQKAFLPFVPLKDFHGISIRFADISEGDTFCAAGIKRNEKSGSVVFIKKDKNGNCKATTVYDRCDENACPIISRYNEKQYIVWTERGLIMSSYLKSDGDDWSKPLKYANGNPSLTKLYAVCTNSRYNYFYGVARNGEIILCGTHDILKKPPAAPNIKEAQDVMQMVEKNNGIVKDELIKKIEEQEKILISLKEELLAQRHIVSEMQKRIEAINESVPIAEDGIVDEVLMK